MSAAVYRRPLRDPSFALLRESPGQCRTPNPIPNRRTRHPTPIRFRKPIRFRQPHRFWKNLHFQNARWNKTRRLTI
jgi:hypothetical protein